MADYAYDISGDYKFVLASTAATQGSQIDENLSGTSGVQSITERIFTHGGFFVSPANYDTHNYVGKLYGFSSPFTQYKCSIQVVWRPPTGTGTYVFYVITRSSGGPTTVTGGTPNWNSDVQFTSISTANGTYDLNLGNYRLYIPSTAALTNSRYIQQISVHFLVRDSDGNQIDSSFSYGPQGATVRPFTAFLKYSYTATRTVHIPYPNTNLTVYCRNGGSNTGTPITASSITLTPKYLAAHAVQLISSAGTLSWGSVSSINYKPKDIFLKETVLSFPKDINGNPPDVSSLVRTASNVSQATFYSDNLASVLYEVSVVKNGCTFYSDPEYTQQDFDVEKSSFTGTPSSQFETAFKDQTTKYAYAIDNSAIHRIYFVLTEYGDDVYQKIEGLMPSTVNAYSGPSSSTYLKFFSTCTINATTPFGTGVLTDISYLTGSTTGYTNSTLHSSTVGLYQNNVQKFDGPFYYGAFAMATITGVPSNIKYAIQNATLTATFSNVNVDNENFTFNSAYELPFGSSSVQMNSRYDWVGDIHGDDGVFSYVVSFPVAKKGPYSQGFISTYNYYCRKLACMTTSFFEDTNTCLSELYNSYSGVLSQFTSGTPKKTTAFSADSEDLDVLAADIVDYFGPGRGPHNVQFGIDKLPPVMPASYDDYQSIKAKDLFTLGNDDYNKALVFTAKQANSTVGLNKKSSYQTLEYSTDGGETWNSMTTATTITLGLNKSVYVIGVLSANNTGSNYTQFKMTGNIKASGNINYLWNKDNPNTALKQYCGYYLFTNCTALSDASELELPATTLANYCYYRMFTGCSSLVAGPQTLQATTLSTGCYKEMFSYCNSLTTTPTLPATTLAGSCYSYMFSFCGSLTTAPALPATALTEACYDGMFLSAVTLTTAPTLPATTLANYCYNQMFQNCASLKTPPALPATALTPYCYCGMFSYTGLLIAPVLPSTTLAEGCYDSMFSNSKLSIAPELPATTLANSCYRNMFVDCIPLIAAPVLPALTLVTECYYGMFVGCMNLNYIKCLATDISATDCTHSWVGGVAFSGTFVKNETMSNWPNNVNGIPTGWVVAVDDCPAVKFIAKQANSMVRLWAKSSNHTLEYSLNGMNWSTFDTSTSITLASVGSCVYIRGTLSAAQTESSYTRFRLDGNLKVTGNIGYLWNKTNPNAALKNYCGFHLFTTNPALTDASELTFPSTISSNCYNGMFWQCTGMTLGPTALPATTLSTYCYYNMFQQCSALTKAPILPAATPVTACYYYMFYNCTNLRWVKCLATTVPSTGNCFDNWLGSVYSTGTFIKYGSTSWPSGASGIPSSWTQISA